MASPTQLRLRSRAMAVEEWSLVDGRWLRGDLRGASAHWFDIVGADEPALDDLAGRYGLHSLSIEDCRSPRAHGAKIDEFSDHVFAIFPVLPGEDAMGPMRELDFFLGRTFLITYQDHQLPPVAAMRADLADGRVVRPGPDGLLYELLDRVVDLSIPMVETFGSQIEELEQGASSGEVEGITAGVARARARLGRIRRTITPAVLVANRFARGEVDYVSEQNRVYFRDIYDHLVRVDFTLESLREDTEVALNTYLGVVNNRMNEIMKVLSVVSALALPAVVIAGIFGTNFQHVPWLHESWGFAAMLVLMGALATGMAWYFRRKDWF